jgi:hypothetical protein
LPPHKSSDASDGDKDISVEARRQLAASVFAAGMQAAEHRQIGIAEEPALGTLASDQRSRQSSQVFVIGNTAQVLAANTCQINNFRFGEELLT